MATKTSTAAIDDEDLDFGGGEMDMDDVGDAPINFEDIEETDSIYEPLKKGDYDGFVNDCEFEVSSKGNPMLKFEYKFSSDPEEDMNVRTVTVWDYCVLNQEQIGRSKKRMKQVNPDMPNPFVPRRDAETFIGRRVRGRLGAQKATGDYGAKNTLKAILASYAPDDE